jgi:hypothetical protein
MKAKAFYYTAILLLFTMQQCNKKVEQQPAPVDRFLVLEKGTRKPITGATIDLMRCSRYDIQFGCTGYTSPVATLTTNDKGEASVSAKSIDAVEIQHTDYWKWFFKQRSSGEFLLSPNAWVKVHIRQINANPALIKAGITVTRDCNDCGVYRFYENFGESIVLPTDTTFAIRMEATENTTVQWTIYTETPAHQVIKSGKVEPFRLNRNDTLHLSIEY